MLTSLRRSWKDCGLEPEQTLVKQEEQDTFKKRLRELEQRLGGNPTPTDSALLLIAHQLLAVTKDIRSLSDKMSWLLGAATVAIGLLIAIAVAVF